MNLKYLRESRTASSEEYTVIFSDEYVGHLSLHFGVLIRGMLLLESEFYDKMDIGLKELSSIQNQISEELLPIGLDDDLRLVIARGETVFDSMGKPSEESEAPATKGDLQKLKGKMKSLSGKLTEYIVVDYFKYLGFDSSRAGSKLDHEKVDVVARKGETTIYAQVKNGQVSDREIDKIIRTISSLENPPTKIAIFAGKFSSNSEIFRVGVEDKYNTRVLLISKNDVISCLPEHKLHDKFTSQL
ncbi:restriction endonuclease [Shewanella sp. TB4-MNA-CIBAN-0142]|uniref:restriction endonuclease n=1 Tax=Shewanella sp. TB4-MNA-CIBAN-0142 TaxID=3140464 RepID=UPI0033294B15